MNIFIGILTLVLAVPQLFATIALPATVGKPRQPRTGTEVAGMMPFQLAYLFVLVAAAGRFLGWW